MHGAVARRLRVGYRQLAIDKQDSGRDRHLVAAEEGSSGGDGAGQPEEIRQTTEQLHPSELSVRRCSSTDVPPYPVT
jgi:hypothetical protein